MLSSRSQSGETKFIYNNLRYILSANLLIDNNIFWISLQAQTCKKSDLNVKKFVLIAFELIINDVLQRLIHCQGMKHTRNCTVCGLSYHFVLTITQSYKQSAYICF